MLEPTLKNKFIFLMPFLLSIGLFSCSSSDTKKGTSYTIKEYVNVKPTALDNTSSNDSHRRAGAAIEASDYHHVLGRRSIESLPNDAFDHDIHPAEDSSLSKTNRIDSPAVANEITSYSIYELKHWDNFCGTKDKMNKGDWDFIERVGKNNLPKEYADKCNAPSYSRSDYLIAWDLFCNSRPLTQLDTLITANTIPPHKCVKSQQIFPEK